MTNRALTEGSFLKQLEKVLEAGIDIVILREKDLTQDAYSRLAQEVHILCQRYQTPLYLHTYINTAKEMGLNVHLSYPAFLAMTGEEKSGIEEIGVSIHAVEEAVRAEAAGASYLTAGHIFATDCKKGVPPRGLSFLREVCAAVSVPVYAIGGITPEKEGDCIQSGASGVCLMSSLMRS